MPYIPTFLDFSDSDSDDSEDVDNPAPRKSSKSSSNSTKQQKHQQNRQRRQNEQQQQPAAAAVPSPSMASMPSGEVTHTTLSTKPRSRIAGLFGPGQPFVDFDLVVPLCCLHAMQILPDLQLPKQNNDQNYQIEVNKI